MAENQIEKLMRILQISEAEAKQIIQDDKDIDQGKKKDFDISKEQEKETRKYRQVSKQPTVYQFKQKRERKPNELKREIIDDLFTFLCEQYPEVAKTGNIANIENYIDFTIDGKTFTINLTQHRAGWKRKENEGK